MLFRLLQLLRHIIFFWVRSEILFGDLPKLKSSDDVIYVLKKYSLLDLLVLDYLCERDECPRPLVEGEPFRILFLIPFRLRWNKRKDVLESPLLPLIKEVRVKKREVALIPVSVFWGRNPGREEKSLLKLLFFDDENAGFLQRFFTLIFNGRNVSCRVGYEVSFDGLGNKDLTDMALAQKIRRTLKIHFRQQRIAILGPHAYDPNRVLLSVLSSRKVRKEIHAEGNRRGSTVYEVEEEARRYLEEMMAKMSHPVIRFFDILLSWLSSKMYRHVVVNDPYRVALLAEQYELVYLPSHRSHMDYLLFGHFIFKKGLTPLHTAAGLNLNFWPVGGLLRRGGAFFIRRTFAGNRLYSAICTEYIQSLMGLGFPISFYIEGGRSRTGLLLQPKTGLLAMVTERAMSKLGKKRPVRLIPATITYDKVIENGSYLEEVRGRAKKAESVKQLLSSGSILWNQHGSVSINLGRPIDPALTISRDPTLKSHEIAANLAQEVSRGIARSTVITSSGLLALSLFILNQRKISRANLFTTARRLLHLIKELPFADILYPNEETLEEDLEKAMELHLLSFDSEAHFDFKVQHRDNLAYYKNNLLVLFQAPALMAWLLSSGRPSYNLKEDFRLFMIFTSEHYPLFDTPFEGEDFLERCSLITNPSENPREDLWLKGLSNLYAEYFSVVAFLLTLFQRKKGERTSSVFFQFQRFLDTLRLRPDSLLTPLKIHPDYWVKLLVENQLLNLNGEHYSLSEGSLLQRVSYEALLPEVYKKELY